MFKMIAPYIARKAGDVDYGTGERARGNSEEWGKAELYYFTDEEEESRITQRILSGSGVTKIAVSEFPVDEIRTLLINREVLG